MKFEILVIALLSWTSVKATSNGDLLKIEEEGSGVNNSDTLNILLEKINGGAKKRIDDTESWEGSGKDDEDSESSGSGTGKDETSGSGEPIPVTFAVTKPTVTVTTDLKVPTTKAETSTGKVDVINFVTEKATTKKVSTDSDLTTAGVKATTDIDNAVEKLPGEGGVDVDIDNEIVARSQTDEDEEEGAGDKGVKFTIGIIVGVVVGAILSILIIIFLVYRLRKKDEGSYSLDEPSAAMLKTDGESTPIKKEADTPLIV